MYIIEQSLVNGCSWESTEEFVGSDESVSGDQHVPQSLSGAGRVVRHQPFRHVWVALLAVVHVVHQYHQRSTALNNNTGGYLQYGIVLVHRQTDSFQDRKRSRYVEHVCRELEKLSVKYQKNKAC